jgi:hypothetical protein
VFGGGAFETRRTRRGAKGTKRNTNDTKGAKGTKREHEGREGHERGGAWLSCLFVGFVFQGLPLTLKGASL